ncbi:glycosyl transferase family 8 [Mangrovibacter plantisponsor]|uniref:Glycosyl transferase family 9 (Putative heptosyltransferase) n=1 Tax=Mangrovibacter plantisponsor TaxID=451513 RepID=A0A317Q2D1_9ENTR|nr:glycosyl transferase family 8 [Mangrovibacter plantisponsor]PWW09551.1 hypothetical protein DES37_105206 [Mangrovibacter plantisponsor]
MNQEQRDLNVVWLQVDALLKAECWAEAEVVLCQALASGTGPVALWRQLYMAFRQQGKFVAATQVMDMIVQTVPGDMGARFDLSEMLLLQGEFTRGWREYRFRYKLDHTRMFERHMQKPRWEGQPVKGKTLLIHDEQGYGDTFQFLRLVEQAQERSGAHIILEVNQEACNLARRVSGYNQLIVRGTLPPPFDFHCELMSLPAALGLQLSQLPGRMPYLFADPERVEKWRARLAGLPRPLVGLVWAGSPTHANDKRRSLTLADLAPLALEGITFLALQKGPAAEQAVAPPPGMSLLSLSGEIHDFDDTAAILTVADILVSVDSSPVHLAGALGRPAWVLLPFLNDWRWLIQRDDSPWYPGMRLFRQPVPGQWETVLQNVAAALKELKGKVDVADPFFVSMCEKH